MDGKSKPNGKLTPKQQAFVDAYEGNGTDAARKAGYRGSDATLSNQANRLMRNAEIKNAIACRTKAKTDLIIASRAERQAFWTRVANDPEQRMKDRLKASELLGKSEADFTERVHHSGSVSLEALVAAAHTELK